MSAKKSKKTVLIFGVDITGVDLDALAKSVPMDPDWLSVCTEPSGCEVFGLDYCGYWMHGRDRSATRGWLCWEHDDIHDPHEPQTDVTGAVIYVDSFKLLKPLPGEAEARAAWEAGLPMPEGGRWHRLDKVMAERAHGVGVAAKGVDWFENGDATVYDAVLQIATLGEIRYG